MGESTNAPDGGWGWIITFSAFMVAMLMDGISFAFGILFKEILLYFDQTKSLTSWIISVYNGTTLLIGPVAQILISGFGTRKVAIFGALLGSVSLFLSTFSPNIHVMIVLFGLLGGSGLGLIHFPSIVLISHYFTSKRGLSTGKACCGSGVGGFVFPPLLEFLIAKYTWQGAMWISSAIVLNSVPLGILLIPLKQTELDSAVKREMNQEKKGDGHKVSKTIRNYLSTILSDMKVLKSPLLLLYGTSCFLCNVGAKIPFTFLPDLTDDFGMTSQEAAILISIIGIFNTIGRILVGWTTDRLWVDPVKLNSLALIIGGVATLFVPKYSLCLPMSVYCVVFGLCIAVFVTCQPIISLEISGIKQMSAFYGIVRSVQGLSTLIGAPVAGMLVDQTGNYEGAFYMAGAAIALAGFICLPLRSIQHCTVGSSSTNQSIRDEIIDNSVYIVESTV